MERVPGTRDVAAMRDGLRSNVVPSLHRNFLRYRLLERVPERTRCSSYVYEVVMGLR